VSLAGTDESVLTRENDVDWSTVLRVVNDSFTAFSASSESVL